MTPNIPPEIRALQEKYRSRGTLTADELDRLLKWTISDTDQRQLSAKEAGDLATLKPDDLVAFTMPATTQGGVYTINRGWYGKCEAPYAVFLELQRMREQDIIGLQELTTKRGEAALGTGLKDYIEFHVPPLTCRLVKRAEAKREAA